MINVFIKYGYLEWYKGDRSKLGSNTTTQLQIVIVNLLETHFHANKGASHEGKVDSHVFQSFCQEVVKSLKGKCIIASNMVSMVSFGGKITLTWAISNYAYMRDGFDASS